jgi:hypothetical protein
VASGTSCDLSTGSYFFSDVQISGAVVLLGPVTITVSNSFNLSTGAFVLGNGTGQAVGVAAPGCVVGSTNTGGVHGGIGGPGTSSVALGSPCGSHEWCVEPRLTWCGWWCGW